MSEHDSQGSDQKPTAWLQNLYDIWKFIGVIIYQCTLTLMIAYYVNSNFASQYLLDVFGLFMIVRPGLICTYSSFVTFMEAHKTYVLRSKYLYQKKIDERNFEIMDKRNQGENGDDVDYIEHEKTEFKKRMDKIRDADGVQARGAAQG